MSDKDIAPKNKTSRIKKLISIIKRPKREAESGAHLEKRHVVHVTGSGWIPKFSQIRYLPRLLNQKENIVLKGALALFVVGIISLTDHFSNSDRPNSESWNIQLLSVTKLLKSPINSSAKLT